jgi:hypothetical protein
MLAFLFLISAEAFQTCVPLTGYQANTCARLEQILVQYPDQCTISSWLQPHCSACGQCQDARSADSFDFESIGEPAASIMDSDASFARDDSFIPEKILTGATVSQSDYINRYGYVAAISGGAGQGTGFMVNSRWGITVKHINLRVGSSRIRPAWRRRNSDGTLHSSWLNYRTVSRFCNHPTQDVAIFQTDTAWPNSRFALVSGYNTDRQIAVNNQIRAIGWGRTVMETGSLADTNFLRTSTGFTDLVDNLNVPNAFRGQNLGTCPGDSGSPATSLDGSVIFGVQFNIAGACTGDSSFARYTNLHRINAWVRRVINNGDFSQCA